MRPYDGRKGQNSSHKHKSLGFEEKLISRVLISNRGGHRAEWKVGHVLLASVDASEQMEGVSLRTSNFWISRELFAATDCSTGDLMIIDIAARWDYVDAMAVSI